MATTGRRKDGTTFIRQTGAGAGSGFTNLGSDEARRGLGDAPRPVAVQTTFEQRERHWKVGSAATVAGTFMSAIGTGFAISGIWATTSYETFTLSFVPMVAVTLPSLAAGALGGTFSHFLSKRIAQGRVAKPAIAAEEARLGRRLSGAERKEIRRTADLEWSDDDHRQNQRNMMDAQRLANEKYMAMVRSQTSKTPE